jgi:hypothetical protein
MVDPGKIAGAGIGIANSLVNAIKGIKQVRDGKKIQERLDAQGRPILETPEAFNEVEGLVRSNYLDPRLLGETRIKDEIKARESNQIQNIQDTASSGADALMAYNMANANTNKSLFDVDMKAYDQQRADYSALLSTLGQKAGYQEKQFDANVMQPFIQDTEQAKALIAAGEQNRNSGFENMAGYVGSGLSGLMKNKSDTEPPKDNSTAPPTQAPTTTYNPFEPKNIFSSPSANTLSNVTAAQGVMGNTTNTGNQLSGINIGQLEQLLKIFAGK